MPAGEVQHELLIWTDASQVELAGRLVEQMDGAKVLAVGGPRKAAVKSLAETLQCQAFDDLRQMLVEKPASSVLVTTMAQVRLEDLRQAVEQAMDVLTLEPACDAEDRPLWWPRGQEPPGRLVHAPMLRLSPAWLSAAEPLEVIGRLQAAAMWLIGPTSAGSLFARLYDAMDWLVATVGLPEGIDACLTGPLAEPPESLAGLTGQLSAHLRLADGAAVTVLLADRAACWSRQLLLIGRQGQLVLDDRGYQLTGEQADETDATAAPNDPVQLIARQWRWMLDHRAGPAPADTRQVIAACRAALLSARTGETESPQTFLRHELA